MNSVMTFSYCHGRLAQRLTYLAIDEICIDSAHIQRNRSGGCVNMNLQMLLDFVTSELLCGYHAMNCNFVIAYLHCFPQNVAYGCYGEHMLCDYHHFRQ